MSWTRVTLRFTTLAALLLCGRQASFAGRSWHVGESVKVPFERAAVHCEIASLKSSYKPGESPEVTVLLVNDTRERVNLVGSLDDSERKARYPFTYFEVLGPADGVVLQMMTYCGSINTLRDVDFVEVPPGGRLDPFMQIDNGGYFPPSRLRNTVLAKPGTYTLIFHYVTDSDDLSAWHAEEDSDVAGFTHVTERLRLVPRVNISCSVEVRVNQ